MNIYIFLLILYKYYKYIYQNTICLSRSKFLPWIESIVILYTIIFLDPTKLWIIFTVIMRHADSSWMMLVCRELRNYTFTPGSFVWCSAVNYLGSPHMCGSLWVNLAQNYSEDNTQFGWIKTLRSIMMDSVHNTNFWA